MLSRFLSSHDHFKFSPRSVDQICGRSGQGQMNELRRGEIVRKLRTPFRVILRFHTIILLPYNIYNGR